MMLKNSTRLYRFILYVVVVILVNMAGATLFFRADLTANNMYSLSSASREAVATLSDPLTIKVFFNSNLPAPYNNIERYLHDLLSEYAVAGGRYFNYEFYNVSDAEDAESAGNRALAESYGIQPVQIRNIEQDEVKFQNAYMGMALIHGDLIETMPAITSTEGLEYAITSNIRKMNDKISAFLRLEDKIHVKLFLSSSLRAVGPYMNIPGLGTLPEEIEDIVDRLNKKNFGKLTFVRIDPAADPELEKEAARYGVMRLAWDDFTDRRGERINADQGYAGIVVEHGDDFQVLELIDVFRLPVFGTQYQLAGLRQIEEAIDETVENVIDINEEIGYLVSHGTHSIGPDLSMMGNMQQDGSLSSLNSLISEQYSIRHVNLKDGGIPEGISFLIVAGAREEFTDYELYQIDQFLMKGNSAAFFLDMFNETQSGGRGGMQQFRQPVYLPVNTGLEKLLSHYGLNIKRSIVLDENCYRQAMPDAFGGGERRIYYAPIIKNEMINKDLDFMKNIKGLVMLKASPVEVNEERTGEDGPGAVRLFSSSERSWEMSGRINMNPMFLSPPSDEKEFTSIPMAYILEGPLTSYFADRPMPVKDTGSDAETDTETDTDTPGIDMSEIAGGDIAIREGRPAKIFLAGTSRILKDNVIDEEGRTPNAQFVMNVIDYLNGREEIAVMRSKTQKFNPLEEISPASRTMIKTANIAGLPVLVVFAGIIVWGRRASRKRMIQKMFSQRSAD